MTEGTSIAEHSGSMGTIDLMRPEPLLVARGGRDGRLSYVNEPLAEFLGRPAGELVGQILLDLTPEPQDSRQRLDAVTQQAAHTVSELWMDDARGRTRRVQWVTFPERTQDGQIVGFQTLGRDITTLVEICDALLARERPPIASNDLLFVADNNGRFRAFHAPPDALLFSPPDVFLGATIETALPPDLAARSRVALGTALTIGLPQTFDYALQRDGVRHGFRTRILRIDPERALYICRDIDAASAADGPDPTRGLLAAVPDLILRAAVDGDGAVRIEPINDNESTLSEFLEPARSVRAALDELVRRAVRSGEQQVLHEFQSSKRSDRATYEARVVRSDDREAICFVRNIAERQQQLVSIMEADRVRAISALVAGVGHQINNPLSYVMGNLDFLRAELDEVRETLHDSLDTGAEGGRESMGVAMAAKQALEAFDNVAEALNDIDEGVNRISGIVHDLRVFNQDSHDLEPVDVCEIIDEALAIVDNEVRHRAQLERKYVLAPAYVFGNRGRLQQLFLNVLLNAAHAIDEGAAASNDITVEVTRSDEDWVDIMISDSGRGMAPEVVEQVFDPFFTTKPVGEGSGLGLAVCREIARLHGGRLAVDSEQHIGTDVTVRLCAAAEPPDHDEPDDGSQLEDASDEVARVLLVDDEPGVGRVVPRMLGNAARVTFFATARAALDEIESGAEFDLVLCDVMMPEMTGMQFYEKLLQRDDQLAERVVFVTGGAFTHAAQTFLDEVDAPVLYKPFDRAALHAVLTERRRRS